jgi:serine/threonine protein kinase
MGDMWGLGMIVHELLSKTMPFDIRIPSDAESTANMTAQTWKHVSLQAIDFVQFLLMKDPNERIINPKTAAMHEWI